MKWSFAVAAIIALSPAFASAQQAAPAANSLDAVPEAMPFNTPYGAPISLAKADAAIAAIRRTRKSAAGP